MNKIYTSKFFLLVLFLTLSSDYSFGFVSQQDILIDQKEKLLIAPAGGMYQWFENGNILQGEINQSLHVNKGGNYTVQFSNGQGLVTKSEINIAVSSAGAIIKIILIGDSTVANAPANLYPNMGWGQVFQFYFNTSNIQVMNFAKSGTSTTTFYGGYWPAAKKAIAAGDYVLMQFGHNDQKESIPNQYAAPYGKYQEYLTKYVNEVREKGAIPILVTSVNRNIWSNNKFDNNTLGSYPDAVRKLGITLKVPVLDLNTKSAQLFTKLGEAYLSNYVMNNYPAGEYPNYQNGSSDKTHFREMGAIEISRLVIECIKEQPNTPALAALIPFLKPLYEVNVTANPSTSASMITRTASYAEGMNITLKVSPKNNTKFLNWNNPDQRSASTNLLYSFKMGNKDASYSAIFKDAVLGVDDQIEVDNSGVYPNPFSEDIELKISGYFEYVIFNLEGVELEKGNANNTIHIGSALNSGMYVIKIYSSTGNSVHKVSKI